MSVSHARKYGEKPSHPIYVWNGVLEPKHKKKIGPALWEFIWLIDRITEEENGIGTVLGGKPIKTEDVAKSLAESERTTRQHFDRLELYGYIDRTRAPYGYVVRVLNSGKFMSAKSSIRPEGIFHSLPKETGTKLPISRQESSDLAAETFRCNKEKAVDESVEEAGKAPAWIAIGTGKLGTPRFRARWEFSFAERNGDSIANAMERCILSCQSSSIPIPKPFYDAKRAVEKRETAVPLEACVPVMKDEPWDK